MRRPRPGCFGWNADTRSPRGQPPYALPTYCSLPSHAGGGGLMGIAKRWSTVGLWALLGAMLGACDNGSSGLLAQAQRSGAIVILETGRGEYIAFGGDCISNVGEGSVRLAPNTHVFLARISRGQSPAPMDGDSRALLLREIPRVETRAPHDAPFGENLFIRDGDLGLSTSAIVISESRLHPFNSVLVSDLPGAASWLSRGCQTAQELQAPEVK